MREAIVGAAVTITDALKAGGKLLLFGNGGSAADAQHIAAELIGRFARERQALPAIALTTDTSAITALANDYSFERTFARQVEALCDRRDVVLAISTSGQSPNVIAGVEAASQRGASTIGLTGAPGGRLRDTCDQCICVPSQETARIQEGHTLVAHILCEIVERELANDV